MPHLTLHLFGPPRVQRDGVPLHIVRRRAVACAVYLAVTGQAISRDALTALFWPETDPQHARADLRRTLHQLHQMLGPAHVVAEEERLRFHRDDDLWLDVEHFRRLLAACQDHGHRVDEVCPACLPLLAAAAVLYRDDFLAGFSLPDAPDFDRWQWIEGEQLRSELASALARLVRGHTAQGGYAQAIAYARRWVALDPLDEAAQRWLMQLYAWSGERSAALHQYQSCVRLLAQELDAEPGAATQRLAQAIRDGRLPPPASAEQLGVAPGRGDPTPRLADARPPEDEVRVVTVLCAGLQPAEGGDEDPETLAAAAEGLLAMAGAACAPYGGHAERLPGGDVLALFGLERTHEDDAERAIRAALAIQQAAAARDLAVQIGLNTGIAYCTRPAGAAPGEALLMGAVVNLAARLRNRAGRGQILVGNAAYRPTRGIFDSVALELALPGRTRPVTAYRILRLRSHPAKERGVEGLAAALIGRDPELAQLRATLVKVLAGQGQLVLIQGAAGVGKSRLVSELREISESGIRNSNLLWLEGRCLELATSAGYWPLVDVLRQYLGEGDAGDEAALAGRLRAMLQELAAAGDLAPDQVEEIGPLLGRLLSLRFGTEWDERLRQVDPAQVHRRTLAAVQAWVAALARRQPVALVFEDLHWGDALSLELIGSLLETLASAPLLLVCVYRPEQAQAGEPLLALARERCPARCTALVLPELTPAHSRQLLASLLAVEQLPESTRALFLAKAQGNPFFLEEIVRAQIEGGLLVRQGESWRAQAEVTALAAPETVQSVILSRVDRLPPALKQLLQTAAVLGRFFPQRLLAALAPAGLDLDAALAMLSVQALVYQERGLPEVEYSFRHVLVQDAVYQALPARRRGPLHQQVGEAMEALYAGNLTPHLERLAYHYDRSPAGEKAVAYLVRAGEKAQAAYANDEAGDYFQRALARLDGLGAGEWGEADAWRLAAAKGLGIIYWNTSKLAEAEVHLHRAIALAHKIHASPRELAQLYGWLCRTLLWQVRLDDLILVGRDGLAQLGDDTRSLEAAILYCNLAEVCYRRAERAEYRATVQRMDQFLASLPYHDDLFGAYGYLVMLHRDFNEIEEGLRWVRFAEKGLQDGHNPLLSAWLLMWQRCRYLEAIGDWRGVVALNERAVELLRQLGDTKSLAWALNHLAERYLVLGELDKAEAVDLEGFALHGQLGIEGEIMFGMNALAGIRYCQGDVAAAIETIEAALEIAQRLGFHHDRGLQRTLYGCLLLAQGRAAEAQAQFQIVMAAETPVAPWMPWIVSALAGLEVAYADPAAFRDYCRDIQRQRPELADVGLRQWWLEPAAPDLALPELDLSGVLTRNPDEEVAQERWQWVDPFGDCAYTWAGGLVIRAANCRDLWANNFGAPRLMQPAAAECAVQVTCTVPLPDRPAIGGLLLWQDKANYLRLTWGQHGPHSVVFHGARDNRNVFVGRGRLLHAGQVTLRLECVHGQVRALCRAGRGPWLSVGQDVLKPDLPVQVGLFASGQIERVFYPGAYVEGTAIGFTG